MTFDDWGMGMLTLSMDEETGAKERPLLVPARVTAAAEVEGANEEETELEDVASGVSTGMARTGGLVTTVAGAETWLKMYDREVASKRCV